MPKLDESISCCQNCKYSSGSMDNLYCYRIGINVDNCDACLMYENRLNRKEEYYEKSSSDGQ